MSDKKTTDLVKGELFYSSDLVAMAAYLWFVKEFCWGLNKVDRESVKQYMLGHNFLKEPPDTKGDSE